MRYLLPAGRWTYRILEMFLLIVAAWLLFAHALPLARVNSAFRPDPAGIRIFIHSNGVHTDFVLPMRSKIIHWDSVLHPADFSADTSYSHVAIGWGDKGFFMNTPTWADLTFSTAFTAAAGIGESAMHATYYHAAPLPGERTLSFAISKEKYATLVKYILATFRRDGKGVMLINHEGYGLHDRFYEANGTYSLFQTCNEWTGDGMEEAGLPVGVWTPLEFGIIKN